MTFLVIKRNQSSGCYERCLTTIYGINKKESNNIVILGHSPNFDKNIVVMIEH